MFIELLEITYDHELVFSDVIGIHFLREQQYNRHFLENDEISQ